MADTDTPDAPAKPAPKAVDAFKSAADIKAWVRKELALLACGCDEDDRKAQNP